MKKVFLLFLMMFFVMTPKVHALSDFKGGRVATADVALIDNCAGNCDVAPKEGCFDGSSESELRYVGKHAGLNGKTIDGEEYEYFIYDGEKYLCDPRWETTCGKFGNTVWEVATDRSNTLYNEIKASYDWYEDNNSENEYDDIINELEKFMELCENFRNEFILCQINNGDMIYEVLLKRTFYDLHKLEASQDSNSDTLSFILFSINGNDLVAVTNKCSLWNLENYNTEITKLTLERGAVYSKSPNTLLICEKCSKCRQDCAKPVAVGESGGENYLSYGCLYDHACLFVQDYTIDSANEEVEGLICQSDERVDGSNFCKDHKCHYQGCINAIDYITNHVSINGDGNLVFGKHATSANIGDYSNYCKDDRCVAVGCNRAAWYNSSTKTDLVSANTSTLTYAFDVGTYCQPHSTKCTICGGDMDQADFDATRQHYCRNEIEGTETGYAGYTDEEDFFINNEKTAKVIRFKDEGGILHTVLLNPGEYFSNDKGIIVEKTYIPEGQDEGTINSQEQTADPLIGETVTAGDGDSTGKSDKDGTTTAYDGNGGNGESSGGSVSGGSSGGSGSGSDSVSGTETPIAEEVCTHNSKTLRYNTTHHWSICNLCGQTLAIEAHSYMSNSNQCTGCSYKSTVEENNEKTEDLRELLDISGTQYDLYIKNNIWAYDAIKNLKEQDIYVEYENLTKNVDVKTYLELLSKVVYKSGAYSDLDPKKFESLQVTVYPDYRDEEYSQDYEFIMLAYGNAFGDKGEFQGKGMYETFFLNYEEWLNKPITRYEMMSLASALFDFSETERDVDVSEAPERFVPYVKKAITSGWYGPYQQDGKTATINQLYLSEEVDIFNTYAFLETVYTTLMTDQIKFKGFIMDFQLYNAIYNKDCEHNYVYNLTDYVYTTGLVTHTLLCDKCGYVFVNGTHKHSFTTSCQECLDIISQYTNPDDTTINDDEAEQEYKDSLNVEDLEEPNPTQD